VANSRIRENRRNKSSSSSPEIRTTPSGFNINNKSSCQEFGYINPKRKSCKNTKHIKNSYESKYKLGLKSGKASIGDAAKSNLLSTLIKNCKYSSSKQSSHSFVDGMVKRVYVSNSIDHAISTYTKHVPVVVTNDDNYRSMLSRNNKKVMKDDKNNDSSSKEICTKKKIAQKEEKREPVNYKGID
jgi:hypothetical protein